MFKKNKQEENLIQRVYHGYDNEYECHRCGHGCSYIIIEDLKRGEDYVKCPKCGKRT